MRGYVAVGHGLTPTGVFDPGAVHPDGTKEYNLNFTVAYRLGELLRRSGVDVVTEANAGPGHDPDYIGSVAAINAGKFDFAIEVHFDTWRAGRGGFGLYYTETEKDWCRYVHESWVWLGLIPRENQLRRDLYFPKATNCPAVIWECDHTGPDVTDGDCTNFAVALTNGTVAWLRSRFNWKPSTNIQEDAMPFQQRVCQYPNDQFVVLTGPDGGIAAYEGTGAASGGEGGSYFGSLPEHPEYNTGVGKPLGPAVDIAYWANELGHGYTIFTLAPDGSYHPYHFNKATRK